MAAVGLWLLGMGRAVVGWLSRRSLMELIAIGLSLVCLVQFATIRAEKRHSAKLQAQVISLNTELRRISTARDTQKQTTEKTIERVKERVKSADDTARKIEAAPLPGNCTTPTEVLEADV